MTSTAPPVAMTAEVAALQRAMPITRLVDCGMDLGDAVRLHAETTAGADWSAAAGTIAESLLHDADTAEAAGHRQLATVRIRRAIGAAQFAQMAQSEDTDRKRELYRRYVEAVRRLQRSATPAIERVEIPHRGATLVGWLWLPPAGHATATVVLWGGLTGWGAAYLRTAEALVARGIACLMAEGPGQGEPRLFDRLHLDEHVIDGFIRFVDHVEADPRLGARIGIQGNSFGGLFAAHVAARDDRVHACVVNGAPSAPVLPPFRTAREQIQAAVGLRGETETNEVLSHLRFDPGIARIGCPVLVLHGDADPLVTLAEQEPFAEASRNGSIVRWADGEHTIYNHGGERDAVIADWFERALGSTATADPLAAVRPGRPARR